MKILSISDTVITSLYSSQTRLKFSNVDFVIACGDLPYYYQEFIISTLNVPLYFVHGNHDPEVEYSDHGECAFPHGGTNLHRKVIRVNGKLIAGVQGSIRYRKNAIYQYSQSQMWMHVFRLIPGIVYNRVRYGRFLDIFVSHASPWGIHDGPDFPHIGIKAFRWFIQTFKPRYHFHGHIHVYKPNTITHTLFGKTNVINTYGYKLTDFEFD